ncbi:MAG: DEAD/DEAH box helicase [Alphaproteobacteria bacterium]|nr:DEAD/DEAH box helicase [Alphaproteobacteria bacterium]
MLMYFKQIESKTKYTYVHGFPIGEFSHRLQKEYNTSRLSHIFQATGIQFWGRGTVRILHFFLPEFLFLLRKLGFPYKFIKELRNNTWIGRLDTPDNQIRNRVNLDTMTSEISAIPLPHQLEFVKEYDFLRYRYNLYGALLGFPPGLGKTLSALFLMSALKKEKVYITCPNSLVYNVWKAEIDTFFKEPQKIWTPNMDVEESEGCRFIIANYESIEKLITIAKYPVNSKGRIGIVVDESHNFLRLKSNRTKYIIGLRGMLDCEDMILMSGTPLKNSGLEIIPMLLMIDRYFNHESMIAFKKAFGVGTNIATDILNARMQSFMHRRTREETIGDQLPEKTLKDIKIKLTNGDDYTAPVIKDEIIKFIMDREEFHGGNMEEYKRKFYEVMDFLRSQPEIKGTIEFKNYLETIKRWEKYPPNMMSPAIRELVTNTNIYENETLLPLLSKDMKLKKQFREVRSAVKYLHLKIKGEVLGRYLTRKRIQMTSDLLKAAHLENIVKAAFAKTVIFTSYTDTIELAMEDFFKKGFTPIAVYGKTSKDVNSIVKQFQSDKDSNPLVASISMLSTGATLTAADTMVVINRPDRQAMFTQIQDRIYRIGQDKDVTIYTLTLDTGDIANLSTRMQEILESSKQFTDEVVGEDL